VQPDVRERGVAFAEARVDLERRQDRRPRLLKRVLAPAARRGKRA
jgi:hypothetical protein